LFEDGTSVGTTAKLHSLTFIKVYHLHTSVRPTAKLHSLTFIKGYHLQTSVGTTARLHSFHTTDQLYKGIGVPIS
jgi:hypothetical protein